MKPVGEVVRIAQGLAILRAAGEEPPEIGAIVVDEDLATLGRVVDVFGPVERPYLAVSPEDGDPAATLVGARCYQRT